MTDPSRTRPLLLGALALALLAPGCGPSRPAFDPSAEYTPDSLAREFVFRYKALNVKPKRAPAPPRKGRGTPDKAREERVAAKSQDKTKAGPTATLDDLLSETATRAERVPGATAAQTLRKVAEAVGRDDSVPEADRAILAERLNGVAGSLE